MLIKVKYAPDTELVGDMGTSYIVTEHKGFIETLESITDYKVMPRFLDENKQYYTELIEVPEHYDKEIDVSKQCLKNIQDDSMPFSDKQIPSFVEIPRVEVSMKYAKERELTPDEYVIIRGTLNGVFKYEGNPELEEYVQKQAQKMQNSEISELDFLRELVSLQQKEIRILEFNVTMWQGRYYKQFCEDSNLK